MEATWGNSHFQQFCLPCPSGAAACAQGDAGPGGEHPLGLRGEVLEGVEGWRVGESAGQLGGSGCVAVRC